MERIPFDYEEIVSLVRQGYSSKDISRHYRCHTSTLAAYLRSIGSGILDIQCMIQKEAREKGEI